MVFSICFLDEGPPFKYTGQTINKSALTVYADSLKPEQFYQFKVDIVHQTVKNMNESGYVIVKKLNNTNLPLISIAYVTDHRHSK